MRELPLGESDAVMAAVRAYLGDKKKNPFMFNDVEKARILSGEEEGAYGWIAINYLKGALKDDIDKGTKGGEGGVAGAEAGLAASIFHKNLVSIGEVKAHVDACGIAVRPDGIASASSGLTRKLLVGGLLAAAAAAAFHWMRKR